MPSYQAFVLARAPAIARHDPGGARGVFFGYDFHLRDGGIGVIEINTNAGGAMLNAVIARAHRVCCTDRLQAASADNAGQAFEQAILDMFVNEWRLSGKAAPLRTIAIVDVNPEDQYLYPEFILFQRLFAQYGIASVMGFEVQWNVKPG